VGSLAHKWGPNADNAELLFQKLLFL